MINKLLNIYNTIWITFVNPHFALPYTDKFLLGNSGLSLCKREIKEAETQKAGPVYTGPAQCILA